MFPEQVLIDVGRASAIEKTGQKYTLPEYTSICNVVV